MRVSLGDNRLNVTLGKKVNRASAQVPSGIPKTEFQDLQNRVYALEQESESTESDITSLETAVSALQVRMTAVEGSISSISDTVSSYGTAIIGILSRLDADENNISSLLTRMTAAEVQTEKVPTIEGQVADIVSSLATVQNNVANIRQRLEMSVGSNYNLIPVGGNGYADGMSLTHKGVTYTVNSDGSVTANGTASGTSYFYFSKSIQLEYGKTYHVSGCPSGGATNTYRIRCDAAQSTGTYVQDTGNGCLCTPSSAVRAERRLMIMISSGTTVSDLTFYPMVVEGTHAMPYISPATGKDEDARYDIKGLLTAVDDINTTLAVLDDIQSDIEELKDGVITDIADGIIEVGGTANDNS